MYGPKASAFHWLPNCCVEVFVPREESALSPSPTSIQVAALAVASLQLAWCATRVSLQETKSADEKCPQTATSGTECGRENTRSFEPEVIAFEKCQPHRNIQIDHMCHLLHLPCRSLLLRRKMDFDPSSWVWIWLGSGYGLQVESFDVSSVVIVQCWIINCVMYNCSSYSQIDFIWVFMCMCVFKTVLICPSVFNMQISTNSSKALRAEISPQRMPKSLTCWDWCCGGRREAPKVLVFSAPKLPYNTIQHQDVSMTSYCIYPLYTSRTDLRLLTRDWL